MMSLEERNQVFRRIEDDLPHRDELRPSQEGVVKYLLDEGASPADEIIRGLRGFRDATLRAEIEGLESQGIILESEDGYTVNSPYLE